jgi:chromosome segregation ATPase
MRRALSFVVVVGVFVAGVSTWAAGPADRAIRNLQRAKGKADACASRRSAMNNDERYVEQYRTDLAGIDSEMTQLRRRLDELQRQREDAQRRLAQQESHLGSMRSVYDAECRSNETCESYEQQADLVDQQSNALDTELADLRTDIAQTRASLDGLDRRLGPVQREYNEKSCGNLVPGEVDQTVIDRCTRLFGDWNRLQAELNRQSARLFDLRRRHQQVTAQLQALEGRANEYGQYLGSRCPTSVAIRKVRDVTQRRQSGESLGRDLDDITSRVARLQSVRISATIR